MLRTSTQNQRSPSTFGSVLFGLVALFLVCAPTPAFSGPTPLEPVEGTELTIKKVTLSLDVPEGEGDSVLSVQQGEKNVEHILDRCGNNMWTLATPSSKRTRRAFVMGRYCFYIYHRKHGLSGPYRPAFHGEGADAQSGMVTDIRVWKSLDLLVGYTVDNGPIAYLDGKSPTELPAIARGTGAVFLVPSDEGLQLLWLREEGWGIVDARTLSTLPTNSPATVTMDVSARHVAVERTSGHWLVVDLHDGTMVEREADTPDALF